MRNYMRKLRRLCVGMLCMAMMGISLSGCSEKNHGLDPDNHVKITMWHYYSSSQKNAFDKLITEFNATQGKDEGIIVEAVSQGGVTELENALLTSANGDVGAAKMPDLFSAYASSAQTVNEISGLANIKDYMKSEDLTDYLDGYLEEGDIYHDGSLYLFPIAKATELMFINKTAWDSFATATGASSDDLKTWEGLAKISEKYYTYSNGKAFFGRDAMANYILSGANQLGKDLFTTTDGKTTFEMDETVMRSLWDNYYVPYIKGYYLANGKYASDDLKTGDIIAYVGSTSSSTFFPTSITTNINETQAIDYLILPVPNFEGKEPVAIQQGAGVAIAKSDEQHEYASVVFLQWLTDAQRNLNYAAETGYLPVKKAASYDMLDETKLQQMKPIVKDTLQIALEQVNASSLYTFDAFKGSSAVRTIIDNSLKQQAKTNLKTIQSEIEGGADKESVMAKYLSDEPYLAWLEKLKDEINKAME